jgi:hypothetical protein
MKAKEKRTELPLRTITPEEGLAFAREAFKFGKDRGFTTFLLDPITDPIEPRSYNPDSSDPDQPGRRRLHPLLVSGLVCFGLLFAVFVYFSYWG